MIKVLHLRSSGGFLGAEKVVIELGSHLPAYDVEPIIGIPVDQQDVPELAERASALNIRCQLFPFDRPLSWSGMRAIRDFVRTEQIDVIHSHGYREDIYAYAMLDRHRIVATNHLWKRTTAKLKFYAWLDARVMRSFYALVAVSDPIYKEMQQLGFSDPQLRLIENGISVDEFSSAHDTDDKLKEELGLVGGDFVFGMVGSLTKEKGHIYALQALAKVKEQGLQAKLMIVGDGPERAGLEAYACDLGLEDCVIFVGRRKDIPRILQIFSVFVMPSLMEGLPMALLEAMASGLPVVATAVGDIPKLVNSEVGVLVPPADDSALALAFSQMLSSAPLLHDMGLRSRCFIEREFSAQHMAGRYADIYKEIVRHSRSDL